MTTTRITADDTLDEALLTLATHVAERGWDEEAFETVGLLHSLDPEWSPRDIIAEVKVEAEFITWQRAVA